MCLVALAQAAHPRYPLILLGNRDEFHLRPSAAAEWWPEAPELYAGRDLQAGGTWLGITCTGRFGVVINQPTRPPAPGNLSRGRLVLDWLRSTQGTDEFLAALAGDEQWYAGFTLLLGTGAGAAVFTTPAGASGPQWQLPTGITVLSNAPREAPWPKVGWLESALRNYLQRPEPDTEELLALVGRRMPVAEPVDSSAIARARVTPFVTGAEYGTRCSTLITRDTEGRWRALERRFGPNGVPGGQSETRW
jgi:uncharacterized protein with NRDE domain